MNNARRAFTQAAHRAHSQHGSAQAYQLRLAEGFLDRITVNRIPHSWQRQQVRPIANTELDQRALLKLIDEKTFGFADHRGKGIPYDAQPFRERSFLLDPARRQRAKLWGQARERVAALEGGTAGLAIASGHAAQVVIMHALMTPGDELVASKKLYGGSINQFNHSYKNFGWNVVWADPDDLGSFENAVTPKNQMHLH